MKKIVLKKGKEKPILARHHWIFSGAVLDQPDLKPGELVAVYSFDQQKLGTAYSNPEGSLFARMLAFQDQDPIEALDEALSDAIELRARLFNLKKTNCYRLINGEGDLIPGLIIDRYADHLVFQIGTAGIDCLKTSIVELLLKKIPDIRCIYEKSDLQTRKHEGLKPIESVLYGQLHSDLTILENGIAFKVDIAGGQKTGFFLDQREMRQLIGSLSKEKSVLNCFSYSGGFSLYALHQGSCAVKSVDISSQAIHLVEQNILLNQLPISHHQGYAADVFEYLRKESIDEDIVILDPPAFAKAKKDIISACRGYKEINRLAMSKMKKGALLLTASCSYHVDEQLFQQVIFQSAKEAGRKVKILSRQIQAQDHPVNLYHKEGNYLKSFLLEIR